MLGLNIRKAELVFLLKFFIIYGVLQYVIYVAPMHFITDSIASLEASFLGLKNVESTILFDSVSFVINNSCTGFVSASILAAIVFSLKKPNLKKKLYIFVACALALFVINLVRVYLVILFGIRFGVTLAEFAHIISWFLMSAAIIVCWYVATKKIIGVKEFGELL